MLVEADLEIKKETEVDWKIKEERYKEQDLEIRRELKSRIIAEFETRIITKLKTEIIKDIISILNWIRVWILYTLRTAKFRHEPIEMDRL